MLMEIVMWSSFNDDVICWGGNPSYFVVMEKEDVMPLITIDEIESSLDLKLVKSKILLRVQIDKARCVLVRAAINSKV